MKNAIIKLLSIVLLVSCALACVVYTSAAEPLCLEQAIISGMSQSDAIVLSATALSEGTYYLNNASNGRYLYNLSGSLQTIAARISSHGDLIRWNIVLLDDETYTIQSASNTSLYLAASNSSVSLLALSDSTIPNQYRWQITHASGGGCLIKNVYTGLYLTWDGSNVFSTATLGSPGTNTYNQSVWRAAGATWYGDGVGYQYRELPAGYSFGTLTLFSGESASPTLKSEYDDVLWRTADNFMFTGYNTNYVTLDSTTGTFSANPNLSSLYSTIVTATHKVTGRVATFTLVVNPKVVLVGIESSGHDHVSCLASRSDIFLDLGYSDAEVYLSTYTIAEMDYFLDNDAYNVFVSRSHGVTNDATESEMYTALMLSDTGPRYKSNGSMSTLDLTNMKLIMFIGCETAAGSLNLPSVAVARGAKTAVGFTESIGCNDANEWTKQFFELMAEGYSYRSAYAELSLDPQFASTAMTSCEIYGSAYGRLP